MLFICRSRRSTRVLGWAPLWGRSAAVSLALNRSFLVVEVVTAPKDESDTLSQPSGPRTVLTNISSTWLGRINLNEKPWSTVHDISMFRLPLSERRFTTCFSIDILSAM